MFTRQGTVFSSHFWESETLSGHEAGSVLGGLREHLLAGGLFSPPSLALAGPLPALATEPFCGDSRQGCGLAPCYFSIRRRELLHLRVG